MPIALRIKLLESHYSTRSIRIHACENSKHYYVLCMQETSKHYYVQYYVCKKPLISTTVMYAYTYLNGEHEVDECRGRDFKGEGDLSGLEDVVCYTD